MACEPTKTGAQSRRPARRMRDSRGQRVPAWLPRTALPPAPRRSDGAASENSNTHVTTGVVVVGVVAAGNGSQRGDRVGPVAGRRGADDLAMGPVTVSRRLVASREMREDCPLGPAADPPRTRSEPSYPAMPFPSDY